MDPYQVLWAGFPAVIIVMFIVAVGKSMGFPTQYAMGLSLIVAIILSEVAALIPDPHVPPIEAGFIGIAIGAAASGFYSGIKNAIESPADRDIQERIKDILQNDPNYFDRMG
jgi:small basic protein